MGKDMGDMEATKVDLPCLTDGVTSTQTSSTSVAMESSPLVFTEPETYCFLIKKHAKDAVIYRKQSIY